MRRLQFILPIIFHHRDRGDTDGRAVTKSVAFTLVSYQGDTIVGDSHNSSLVYTLHTIDLNAYTHTHTQA